MIVDGGAWRKRKFPAFENVFDVKYSSFSRLILRTYCQVANKLMRHQLRDTVAQVRKASERSRPDEAFTIALDRFVGVLVRSLILCIVP